MKQQGLSVALGALLTLGCLMALGATESTAPESTTGVWSIAGMNVHSSYEVDDGRVFSSGISHDRAILVNPRIVGERVYFTPEMMARMDEKEKAGRRYFFYRDQLFQPDRVYRIKTDAQVYILHKEYVQGEKGLYIQGEKGLVRITKPADPFDFGGDHYLVDPKVVINHESPKVFLDWLHGSEAEWNYDPANPPATARFIPRYQLELLN